MATKGNILSDSTNTTSTLVYIEGTFSPTVTGPAVVPVYSTNIGRYTRIGRQVFVDIYLTGDGGNEGNGATAIQIALPIAASASHSTDYGIDCGIGVNSTTTYALQGRIAPSGTTIELAYFSVLGTLSDFSGNQQNNATRTIRLKFFYEV